ncbi:MAG: hypothetical protein ACPGJP_03070, partial [Hyphomicrobiales bacterium]
MKYAEYTEDNKRLLSAHHNVFLNTSNGGYTYKVHELIHTIVGNQLHAEKQKGNKWNPPIALVVCVCVCIYQYSLIYHQLNQPSVYQDDDMPSQNFTNATNGPIAIYQLQEKTFTSLVETQRMTNSNSTANDQLQSAILELRRCDYQNYVVLDQISSCRNVLFAVNVANYVTRFALDSTKIQFEHEQASHDETRRELDSVKNQFEY